MPTPRSDDTDMSTDLPDQRPAANLELELMNTVVSSSQAALQLLFKAAAVPHDTDDPLEMHDDVNLRQIAFETSQTSNFSLQSPSREVLDAWSQSHFVRRGWLSARECIAYIDLFFANMSNLSLVTNNHFSRHENHATLISEEMLLCSTLLMISSRYHPLLGSKGLSRSHHVHDCLWRHTQYLIQQLTFGCHFSSKSTSRTLGCIEALLLLAEWHPRALAFPEFSSHDVSCDNTSPDICRDNSKYVDTAALDHARWRKELFEPAKRADRMSWMMLGIASTLAHELGVYDSSCGNLSASADLIAKQYRKRLLYLNVNQLALILGCTSFLPTLSNHSLSSTTIPASDEYFWEGEMIISLWIDLTSLLKMASGLAFSNPSNLDLQNGMLDHCRPLLTDWHVKFQAMVPSKARISAVDLLFIDYQYVRMYIGSVDIQTLAGSFNNGEGDGRTATAAELLSAGKNSDCTCIQEVIEASMSILSKSVSLAKSGVLRFCPARVFFRITSACVFLLKALGLGALHHELSEALNLLDKCTECLASLASDDDQPWGKYAILIRRYTKHFRSKHGVTSTQLRNTNIPADRASGNDHAASSRSDLNISNDLYEPNGLLGDLSLGFDLPQDSSDDWLMQPWDNWVSHFDLQYS